MVEVEKVIQQAKRLTDAVVFLKSKDDYLTGFGAQFDVLKSEFRNWVRLHSEIMVSFLTVLFNEAGYAAEEGDVEDIQPWFKKARSSHRKIRRSRGGEIAALEAYLDPFVMNGNSAEERIQRFKWLVSIAAPSLMAKKELTDILDSSFGSFFDSSDRATAFRLGRQKALASVQSAPVDSELLKSFIEPSNIDSLIFHDAVMLITMTLLTNRFFNRGEDSAKTMNFIGKTVLELQSHLGESNSGSPSQMVIEKFEHLVWGPAQYERDPDIIADAKRRLMTKGALSISAWGGAGKTALANKLTYDFAVSAEFEQYAMFTTKLNSPQGELRYKEGIGVQLMDTSQQTTVHDDIRDSRGFLQGCFRRVCLQIIRASGVKQRADFQDFDNDKLHKLAHEALAASKILVVLDNFEDIEEPMKVNDEQKNLLDNEYQQFTKFVENHCRNYEIGKTKSCILITTRGEARLGEAFTLQMLNSDENLALFERVIRHRIQTTKTLPQNIHQEVFQTKKRQIEKAFQRWRDPTRTGHAYNYMGIHPFNTQGAAWTVRDEYTIVSSIDEWNPVNNVGGPEKVAEYCTSRMIENNPDEEERRLLETTTAMGMGKRFLESDFLQHAHKLGIEWERDRVSRFVRKYWLDRQWLEKHPGKSEYRWTYNIHLQVKNTAKLAPKEDTGEEAFAPQPVMQTLNHKSRVTLFEFLNDKRVAEKSKLANALMTLLDEEISKKEDNDIMLMALLDVKLQEIIPRKSWPLAEFPDKSLLDILIDFHKGGRQMVKPRTSTGNVTGSRNLESDFKIMPKGKFARDIWPLFYDLILMTIRNENTRTNEIKLIARRCKAPLDSSAINVETYLDILEACISRIIVLSSQHDIVDSERFDMQIVHDLLPRMFEFFKPWRWVVGADSSSIHRRRPLMLAALQSYDLIWNDQNHSDELRAAIFWTIVALYKLDFEEQEDIALLSDVHLRQLLKFEAHGIKKIDQEGGLEQGLAAYHSMMLRHGSFEILSLNEFLSDVSGQSLRDFTYHYAKGSLNLVRSKPSNLTIVGQLPGGLSRKLGGEMFFRITKFTGSMLYLMPLLNPFGGPLQPVLNTRDVERPAELKRNNTSPSGHHEADEEYLRWKLMDQRQDPVSWNKFKAQVEVDIGGKDRKLMKRIRKLDATMGFVVLDDRLSSESTDWLMWLGS